MPVSQQKFADILSLNALLRVPWNGHDGVRRSKGANHDGRGPLLASRRPGVPMIVGSAGDTVGRGHG